MPIQSSAEIERRCAGLDERSWVLSIYQIIDVMTLTRREAWGEKTDVVMADGRFK